MCHNLRSTIFDLRSTIYNLQSTSTSRLQGLQVIYSKRRHKRRNRLVDEKATVGLAIVYFDYYDYFVYFVESTSGASGPSATPGLRYRGSYSCVSNQLGN